jgi:septal ring factor EnvC (AmiA/AmiB activator)
MARIPKTDKFVVAAEQMFAHEDSRVISSKRDVLMHELQATEKNIARLQSELEDSKAQRAGLEARITGMTNVLNKR